MSAEPAVTMSEFPSPHGTGVVDRKLTKRLVPAGQHSLSTAPKPTAPRPAVMTNIPAHLRRPVGSTEDVAAMLDEAAIGEETAGAESTPSTPGQPAPSEADLDSYYQRFGIDAAKATEDVQKLVKSYAESEKQMRRAENERNALIQAGAKPPQNAGQSQPNTGQPAAQPASQVPAGAQVTVQPFDYKKAGDTWLDDTPKNLQAFEGHLVKRAENLLAEHVQGIVLPMYEQMLKLSLTVEHPDIVTNESWPVIKALASMSQGDSDDAKFKAAITRYREQIPKVPGTPADVAAMAAAAQTPSATASAHTGKPKRYKLSKIRSIMRRSDYGQNQNVINEIERAFAEGRVERDE